MVDVAGLYQEYLGRAPEAGVAEQWASVGGTEADVRGALAASQEFQSRAGTVDLYQNVLGRSPEAEGLNYWASQFGSTIDPNERAAFIQAAQAEKPGAVYTSSTPTYAPAPTAAPTDYGALTNQLYQQYLGRPAESGVAQEWAKVGGTAQDIANALAASQEYQSRANIVNLYQNVFQRNPETEGLGYWASRFGSTLEPAEISAFVNAAQAEKPGAFYTPPVTSAAAPGVDYNALTTRLYQEYLGRAPEADVASRWASVGGTEADIRRALGSSQEFGNRAAAINFYENVLGRTPSATELSSVAASLGPTIDSKDIENFLKIAQKEKPGAAYTPKLGDFIPETLSDYSKIDPATYNDTLNKVLGGVFGSPDELGQVKQSVYNNFVNYINNAPVSNTQKQNILASRTPDSVFSDYINSPNFAGKSIDDITNALKNSEVNKMQEANRLAGFAQNIYGLSAEEAKQIGTNLLEGKDKDSKYREIYDQLVKEGVTPEVQEKIIKDAAEKNPNSKFFKDNPALLYANTKLGEPKSNPESSGQYGVDPKTGLPILSLNVAKNLIGNEVVLGAQQEFREKIGQDKLGYDPHSAWQSRLVNGVGIFGVDADKKEITDFDKIEKEIAKLGGVKTERDAEGNVRQVVYKDVYDPESNRNIKQAVDVQSLFPFDKYTGTDTYQKYLSTKENLDKAATSLGVDPNKYTSTKEAYEDLNKKLENKWIVQGRTDSLPPELAGSLKGNHATIQYEAVGDKLVPVKVLNTFDFQDPNTSRGFLGDLATGIGSILSIPPISVALSMAGGLPALLSGNLGVGMASGAGSSALAEKMAESIFNPANLGEKILSGLGASASTIAQYAPIVGQTALGAGMGGLTSGLMTGDLGKAGIGALAGGVGAGVAGGTSMLLKDFDISPGAKKIASEIAGGTAATAVTGQDPGEYALNRLLSAGISGLAGMGAEKAGIPTKGPEAELFKAMVPIITSKQVKPDDVVRLAAAVSAFKKTA